MDDVERSAMTMISRLQKGLEAPSGMYGIPWRKRAAVIRTILAIFDAKIVIDKGYQRAVSSSGDDYGVKDVEYRSDVRARAAQRMREWIQEPDHIDPVLLEGVTSPRGFAPAARRMGADPQAMCAIAVCSHGVKFRQGDALLGIHLGTKGLTGSYQHGHLRWEDDMVYLMTGVLPDMLLRAMPGNTLSRIVDDPVFGDRIVRRIETIDPKEGLARIELLRQVEHKEERP